MTHRLSRLASVEYNTESTFAADTSTYATRLQPNADIDLSGLRLMKEIPSILRQRPHEGIAGVRTFYQGPFSLEFLLTGHGGTAAGAITATDLATLLGHVVGVLNTSCDGGTADAGSNTTSIQGVGINAFPAGHMCRIGAAFDGRGGGQFYPLATAASSSDFTLLVATAVAPNAADVIYASQVVHPSETPGTFETVQSLRFRFLTGNEQYEAHGCWPTSIEFLNLNHGELPRVRIGFDCAWWETTNTTFPSTASTSAKAGAPVANGSFFVANVGTTSRSNATFDYADLAIRIRHECQPIRGPGGVSANQVVIGVRRIWSEATISATFPAEATGTQTWKTFFDADGAQHICITLSIGDGKAIGFYFPRCVMTENPTQRDANGLNRVPVTWVAQTGDTVTTDILASSWRLAMG